MEYQEHNPTPGTSPAPDVKAVLRRHAAGKQRRGRKRGQCGLVGKAVSPQARFRWRIESEPREQRYVLRVIGSVVENRASTVLAAPHTARIARQISVLLFRIERLSCDRKQVVCQKLRWSRRTVHILRLMKRDSEARDVVNLLESTT